MSVRLTQTGLLHVFLLIAITGVIALILITSSMIFRDKHFSQIYRNSQPHAGGGFDEVVVDSNNQFTYGTFQSHNQKIVSNQHGIFLTYLYQTDNRDSSTERSTWRLARSTDAGITFKTIYEVKDVASRAPVIETDATGNIYIVAANWVDINAATFLKFTSANDFVSPSVQKTLNLGTISSKYAMEIDESRDQLYFFTLSGTFTILSFDGVVKKQFLLTPQNAKNTSDQLIQMEYPHLYLDERNNLFAAWTTVNYTTGTNYWSIQFVRSRDGGISWERPTGISTGVILALPIDPTDTGPTVRITLDDETTGADYKNWLSTFLVKKDKAHFVYQANSPKRQHYVRYDLAQAKIDLNVYPTFKGETIMVTNLDGFCATEKGVGESIYCVSISQNPNAVAILRSDDNGSSWKDHALGSTVTSGEQIYALSGSSDITSDGFIIGAYTEGNFDDNTLPKKIKFIRVKTSPLVVSPSPSVSASPESSPSPSASPISSVTPSPSPSATVRASASPASSPLPSASSKALPISTPVASPTGAGLPYRAPVQTTVPRISAFTPGSSADEVSLVGAEASKSTESRCQDLFCGIKSIILGLNDSLAQTFENFFKKLGWIN